MRSAAVQSLRMRLMEEVGQASLVTPGVLGMHARVVDVKPMTTETFASGALGGGLT